jgi:hypothetical protein
MKENLVRAPIDNDLNRSKF